ncbi:MAG: hypothetical protein K2I80_07100 [Ruminococcus sp.]|nr:hypothetical protein [Ruminococcus sp.]
MIEKIRENIIYAIVVLVFITLMYSCVNNDKDKETDINKIYEIVIEIDYERKSFSYNDDATVYIDDEKIGTIKAGKCKKYSINIVGGEHNIWVEGGTSIRTNKSSKVSLKVDDDNTYFPYKLKDGSIAGLSLSVDYSKK